MAEHPSSARAMRTACVAAEPMAASARRTGFGTRASKIPGNRVLALGPVGVWREAHTPRAPWAAQVVHVGEPRAVSPAALAQRMPKGALAVLQALLRPALAHVPAIEPVCEAGLWPCVTHGARAESPGCGLPDRVHALVPGAGGRATNAGANMPAVGA